MTRRRSNSGFIMIAILAVMAMLAGLVGAVSLVVRSNIASTRIEIDQLTGDALLRAGLEIAAYKLVTLLERPDEVDGQLIRLDDGTVTVFATPGGGKVDINASNATLLAAVYKASGLKSMRPEEFAARVVDWRDADDEPVEKGAESDAYQELPYGPANEPFRIVDELQWLLGVSAADVIKLKPLLTVHNPKGTINLFDAPREMLEALPGVRRQQVDRILKLRGKRTTETAQQMLRLLPDAKDLVNAEIRPDQMMLVRLEVRPNRGPARTADAVLMLDPTGREAYRVAGWLENGIGSDP